MLNTDQKLSIKELATLDLIVAKKLARGAEISLAKEMTLHELKMILKKVTLSKQDFFNFLSQNSKEILYETF